ncbi:MAG: DUF4160 domain-containing protein [Candidatus Omnitrophota bacterium]|nr:MAG: DUF4160 domain-containing protein [Candidatus Omnitrophota bacterium]
MGPLVIAALRQYDSELAAGALVVAWIEIHQEDLLADWHLAVTGKKPFPIRGLDNEKN